MASEEWAGFTDEDIQRIHSNPSKISAYCNDGLCNINGSCQHIQNRRPMKIKGASKRIIEMETESPLPNASFKKRVTPVNNEIKMQPVDTRITIAIENENKDCFPEKDIKTKLAVPLHSGSNISKQSCSQQNRLNCADQNENVKISNDTLGNEESYYESNICKDIELPEYKSLAALEAFEERQKRIQADNARRKSLIVKTIMDKKKRTQAEAVKLVKIQKDLNHLDSILSSDVSILRNCIERASLEFSEAEKRYLKAEKEFVEAKLLLFEKMQRKEQLTEHLCTIIEQNETRKANKLVELMKQLEMEAVTDDCNENQIQPVLANLCGLNDEAYHCCQTLKQPQPKKEQHALSTEEPSSNQNSNCESAMELSTINEKQNEIETQSAKGSSSNDLANTDHE